MIGRGDTIWTGRGLPSFAATKASHHVLGPALSACLRALVPVVATIGLQAQIVVTPPRVTAQDIGIMLSVTTSPNLVARSQAAVLLATITNQNPAGNQQLQTGDRLTLDYDLGDGILQAIPTSVIVTSTTLSAQDFTVTQGSDPQQILIVYDGPPAAFAIGDAIALRVPVVASSFARTNRIRIGAPGNNQRFVITAAASDYWTTADFSFGTPGPQGISGPQGPAGPAGTQGPTGFTGPPGPAGATGPPVSFSGVWNPVIAYSYGDTVFFNGSAYISALPGNLGTRPDSGSNQWSLLVQQGASGPAGPIGPAGPFGPAGTVGPAGPAGATGPQGAQGNIGPAGPQGSSGATGSAGPQGPPVSFLGPWQNTVSYVVGNTVSFANSSYIALNPNTGQQPDLNPGAWALLAKAGADGAAGTPGATGPAGPAGAAGAAGTPGSPGAAGLTGPTGPAGPPLSFEGAWSASTTYSIGDAVSLNGSSYIAVTSNVGQSPDISPLNWGLVAKAGVNGPQGAQGPQGPQGTGGPTGATGPQGPAGPTGPAGPAGTGGMLLGQFYYPGASGNGSPFFGITSSGDSTLGGTSASFAQNAVVLPISCTANTLYVFQQSSSGSTVTVTLYKSSGGTGAPAATALSVTAGNNAGNHATASVSVAAGDTLAYQVTGSGILTSGTILSTGLLCQ